MTANDQRMGRLESTRLKKSSECLRKQMIIDCICMNSELSNRENTMMYIRNISKEWVKLKARMLNSCFFYGNQKRYALFQDLFSAISWFKDVENKKTDITSAYLWLIDVFEFHTSGTCWVVPGAGLEPARIISPRDFKSRASTDFATRAK